MDLALVLEVGLGACGFLVVAVFVASVIQARLRHSPDSAVLVGPVVTLLVAAIAETTGWATVVQVFGSRTPFTSQATSIVPSYELKGVLALALFVAAYCVRIVAWRRPRARRPLLMTSGLLTTAGLAMLWATVLPLPLLLGFHLVDLGTLTDASVIAAAALTAILGARALSRLFATAELSDTPAAAQGSTAAPKTDLLTGAVRQQPARDSSFYQRPPSE
jgi:hypothetical protein